MYKQLKLDHQLCFRLYAAARMVMQAYTPLLHNLGITYPQYLVLMVLWENDGQPVNDIAHRLLLETNTVTPLLQRMEKEGLVTRHRGTVDKRQQIVSLTQKGKELEESASAVPLGLGKRMASCPMKLDDYILMAQQLDSIVEALKEGKTAKQK